MLAQLNAGDDKTRSLLKIVSTKERDESKSFVACTPRNGYRKEKKGRIDEIRCAASLQEEGD